MDDIYSEEELLDFDDGASYEGEAWDAAYGDSGADDYEGNFADMLSQGMPVYVVFLEYSRETFYAIYKGEALKTGAYVILHTRYGLDIAQIRGELPREMNIQKVILIEGAASEEDLIRQAENNKKEDEVLKTCKERASAYGLDMKLVKAHFLYDSQKIIFLFTADNRVDFRALVKDLVGIFKTRIELRQITARDELRITGGFGICGRCYCCATISDKLKSVSIKMAKEQNLSLNTAKISGPCGRLLCCLSYEYGFYSCERKNLPPEGTKMYYENENWRVKEVNPIGKTVTLFQEDGRQIQLPSGIFVRRENNWVIEPV